VTYCPPSTAWKNLFRDPVSIPDPLNRAAAPRYRGFHQNDVELCIGCGTCETICQNGAIDMVPVEASRPKKAIPACARASTTAAAAGARCASTSA
jgi:formate hydrogenlyase subunit 6/NADH:ubiquinone oxidoreductase subunit I